MPDYIPQDEARTAHGELAEELPTAPDSGETLLQVRMAPRTQTNESPF